ncbi:M23 family metallopeptidase [Rubrivirga sp.]|uniref:M23 family metallopeptidase n=1 Tax=Rubrivirga sp. TaxID=1885344 RepID=UPI003B52F4C8
MRALCLLVLLATAPSCDGDPSGTSDAAGCDGQVYAPPQSSAYVLPYPVGTSYRMNLGNCSSSFHSADGPDRYAYDFGMPIGTPITAAHEGTVVHVEESGRDGGFPNNLVVVEHDDGTFAQYMHLTRGGADVEAGAEVRRGDAIGRSGNTGLAGTPHLHFVVTTGGWRYPYAPVPVTFSNASPLATVLREGETYRAAPY